MNAQSVWSLAIADALHMLATQLQQEMVYWVACFMTAAVYPDHIAELAMFDKFAPELRADIERFFLFLLADRLNDAERERLYLHLQAWSIRRRNPRISA